MSNQELLTFLFNAITLGFLATAAMDFGTRAVTVCKQVSIASSSPLTSAQQPISELHLATIPQTLPQLPDPWLLPMKYEASISTKTFSKEQKHLRLLPQAKVSAVASSELERLLQEAYLDKLRIRQASKDSESVRG